MKKVISIVVALTILLSIALPVSAGALDKISGLKQTGASSNSVEVSWNRYTGADKYKVEYSDSANGTYKDETNYNTDGTEAIYSLFHGTTYYVRVTPFVSGAWLNAAATTLQVDTAPDSVENLKQKSCTESSATFTWTASSGATAYNIYKYTDSTETYVGQSKTTSYTLKGLSNKKDIPFSYIHVRPVRKTASYAAEGYYTSLYSYNIKLKPAKPKAPKLNNYYSSSGNIYLEGPEAKFKNGYQFKIYNASGKKTVETLNNTCFSSDLKKGRAYKVRARVYTILNNTKIYGKWSKYTYFTTGVDDLRVTSKTKTSVRIAWKKIKGAKVKYNIYVSKSYKSGLKKFKKNLGKNACKVTKYGKKRLKKSTYYYFYVFAKIKVGKKYKTSPVFSYVTSYTSF